MQMCSQEGGPYATNVGAPVGRLRVIGPGTRTIWNGSTLASSRSRPIRIGRSRAAGSCTPLDSEDNHVTLDATKDADEVD